MGQVVPATSGKKENADGWRRAKNTGEYASLRAAPRRAFALAHAKNRSYAAR